MEEYIGPDGRRKVRMTQSEFNAANGIKPALVANAPLRPPAPPQAPQTIYPGQAASLAPETPVPAFIQGMAGWPGEGVQHGLGNAARSLAVMAPFGLATGGLGALGYGLGMVGGGAADRVISKNLEAGYTGTPRTTGEQVRSAVEGGAMGLGSALLGGAAGAVAGKMLPTAAGQAPRLGTQAAMATGEALGWEGVSAPVEGRPVSPANIAQDVMFFTALKGVEAVPGLGSQLTSAISPEQALSEAYSLPDLPEAPPAPAQTNPNLAPLNAAPLTEAPMGKAETEALIDELNATLMRRKNLPALDATEALRAAISKPAPYDYNPGAELPYAPLLEPQRPVESIPSQPAEMPMLPERSTPARQSLAPLTSQPLNDPNAPMTKGDMAEFLDGLNRQIEARNRTQSLESMGNPLPAPKPRTQPAPQEPTLPGAPIEDYQRRSMLGRVARQEGDPGIAPTPEVFEPMGGGGGYVGPPQPERPAPREFEQPFIPGDRNEPDFRSLVPAGAKIQADLNTNSPEISMKSEPAPKATKQPYEMTREEYNSDKPPLKPRESFTLNNYGSKTEAIQNPTNEDIARLSDAVRSRFPDMPKGDVKLRFTRDENGNEYVWQAHEGMHSTIEPMLEEITGASLNQNAEKKPHRNVVYDALLNGKKIPPEVLSQYPEVVAVYNETRSKPNPQQAPQNAPESIISPKPSSDTPALEISAPEPVESVISEPEPAPKAPIPPELEKARLDFQNQETLINGRLTRNQTVAPYLEKRRDTLLDALDKKLEEVYPGIGPDERAAFIDSGRVPGIAQTQAPAPERSLLTEERGAVLRPGEVVSGIKDLVSPPVSSKSIRSASLELTGGQIETRVRLADLREKLGGTREQQDAALLKMQRDGEAVLMPNDDPQDRTPRDEAAKLMLGDNRRDIVYIKPEKRSLLSEESGAGLRPGEVLKGIKDRISEAAASTPAGKTKAFVAKQKELRKKYHSASYEEKLQIREELIATNEAFQKDLGLDPERVKSLYEERVTKGLAPTFTADTTPYEGKNRVELAAIAKEMGVPVRGTNEALIQQIANKAELRRIGKTPGRTPEQLQDSISRVTKTYKEATVKKWGVRGSIKNFVRGVDAALIDSRNPMKKENRARFGEAGEDANRLAEKAVTSPVHVQIEVNETIDSIFGDLDSKTPVKRADYYQSPAFLDEDLVTERDLLNELIVAKSSYELAKKRPDHLFTNGNTEADFKATLDAIEASPAGEKLLAKADEYFTKMQEMVEDLYGAGVITEKYRDELLENQHYMPRKVFKEDVNAGIDSFLYKINMNDTLHEPLSGGSLEAIENDSSLLMAHVIQRTRQRIANNDTAVELINLFDGDPNGKEDGFAVRKTKAQQEAPVPTGHSVIKGFVDGVERQLVAPDWYVDSYRGHDKHRANETAVKLAKFSGAGLLRESATGALAPYFFTRNFAKDVVHLWQTQDAYSAALPKAAYDIVKDVWAVKGDAWQGLNGRKARGLLRDYLANGGGGATMSEYTNSARNPQGRFKGFLHAMGSMNQWSEQAVRLAHYKHLIDKGVDPRAAAAAARDRINFSQGGWLTKNLNLVAPYTNARVQGTRSLVVAAKRDPKRFAKVQAQSLGLSVAKAAAIYAAGEWADDQLGNPLGRIYDMISDEEKVHNHIIPTPFGRYEKGVFKPFYFRIAKDESEKIPTYIGEQIGRIFSGRAPNWQPLEEVISGSTVASDIGSFVPPIFQAFLAYAGNYDLFRREYVYKGGDVTDPNFGIDDRSLERKNANDFFQDAGALTGLSPDGSQAALGKLLNGGNPMWGPFSEAYSVMKAMSGGDVEREKEISQHYADILFSLSGGVGRFVRSDAAAVGVQIAENRRTNRESVLQNEEIEKLTKGISKASDVAPAMRKAFEWVNTLPVEQRGAVARRLVNAAEMKTYPEEVQGLARELFWMKEPKLQALNYLNSQLSGDKERRKTASIAFGASGAASDGQTQLYYSKLEGKFREKLKAAKDGEKISIDLKSEAAWLDMP